jgi:hypothetical protein
MSTGVSSLPSISDDRLMATRMHLGPGLQRLGDLLLLALIETHPTRHNPPP